MGCLFLLALLLVGALPCMSGIRSWLNFKQYLASAALPTATAALTLCKCSQLRHVRADSWI